MTCLSDAVVATLAWWQQWLGTKIIRLRLGCKSRISAQDVCQLRGNLSQSVVASKQHNKRDIGKSKLKREIMMFKNLGFNLLAPAVFGLVMTGSAAAASYKIAKDASLFAIITHKDGIGQSFAHNHLILTKAYESDLTLDEEDLLAGSFNVAFPVQSLVVDDPSEKATWWPLVAKYQILPEPFTDISDTNRASVRSSMLSAKQLDAARFPQISATAHEFRPNPLFPANSPFSHIGKLTVTIRDKSVSKIFPLHMTFAGDVVTIESTVKFNFTDFGIEPFSAFLGAVKNQNGFDVLVKATGIKQAP